MKRKLFLLLCALLTTVGMWAQGWTPSEVAAGDFYLYNVGANAYLENGACWGTHAALKKGGFLVNIASVGGGKYTIGTNSKYSGKYFTQNGYVDTAAPTNWTFEPVEGQEKTYRLKTDEGYYAIAASGMYNVTFRNEGDNEAYWWKLVTEANRNASTNASYPDVYVEWTHKFNNPRFDDNNSGWSGNAPAQGGNKDGTNGNEGSFDGRNPCAEHYNTTYDTYQEFTGLANGIYTVKVQGFYREGGYVDAAAKHVAGTESLNAVLYANSTEQPLMSIFEEAGKASSSGTVTTAGIDGAFPNNMYAASNFFSAGLYWNTLDVAVTDGTLRIGVKKSTAVGADWTIFDNFRLQYRGVDLTAYKEQMDAAIVTAESIDQSLLPTTIKNNLASVISTYKGQTYYTEEDYLTAINAINAAITTANASIAPYAVYNTLRTDVQALYDVDEYDELVADAHTTLGTALSTAATNVAAAEDADDIESVTATMKTAAITYAGNANPTNEAKPFDLTFMLTNPDVSDYWTGAWGVKPDGWYTDHSDGNFQVMANEDMGPGGEVFMEYWSESAKTSGFCLNQKVTLDEGTYKMTGRVGLMQDTGGNNAKMTFSANETDGTQIVVGSLANQEVEFVNTSNNTEVKVGIKAHTGNTYRWIGINKIKLYKIPAKTYTVDEDDDWDYSTSGAGDVTLERTIKVGINTLVLPFSMTQGEVESTFGTGSVVYEVSSYESNNISFESRSGIAANEPCLLKATEAGTSYDIEGRTIVAAASAAPSIEGTNVSMIGGYNASNDIEKNDNNYVISGGKIYFVDSDGVTMKGTRAYINITTLSPARELLLNLDDEVTAISAIEEVTTDGQKDGKFLQYGKIVIVKNGVKYSTNGQKLN